MMASIHTPAISSEEAEYDGDDLHFGKRGCCFWSGGSSWWERIRASENDDRWWMKGWKKFREWSEIVAGPKWKTFIRRFNKNRIGGNRHGNFRYDPLSYALNFDEGPGQSGQVDEDYVRRDFSSRYAAIPSSAKSSMDLGRDGPSFT